MKRHYLVGFLFAISSVAFFVNSISSGSYVSYYHDHLQQFERRQEIVLELISKSNLSHEKDRQNIKEHIALARAELKVLDFWFRYLEPIAYKKINGPLPVEWETEVFEKYEKPYKREGAGLTLAELYLEEAHLDKKVLEQLMKSSAQAVKAYKADSITSQLKSHHHFYLCNRLFLLNLAAIYTTGFECPEAQRVIPELLAMLKGVAQLYQAYNHSFPSHTLPARYLELFQQTIAFVGSQPSDFAQFDHFSFVKDHVNKLFAENQKLINEHKVVTRSYVDYSLSNTASSIFDKTLYKGQNPKGIFLRVKDEEVLSEIDKVGKLLFYDPILSGNNQRSCVSCHKSFQFFTDTVATTAFQFDRTQRLPRNTPSLVNVSYQHLLMADGKHFTLQDQTKAVITSPIEMGGNEKEIVKKVLSCKEYKMAFTKFLKYTPQENEITLDHIASAITLYYGKFSKYYAPFDEAVNHGQPLSDAAKRGFNLFMSKAQCATCHFVPQFNGVKPPYVGSEFEVLGVPHVQENKLSLDMGRHDVNPAEETKNAFRTGTVRNAAFTKPYMHNGVFGTLEEVIDFYDAGGGTGRGLTVDNQTLSSDSLRLTKEEKQDLIAFVKSLNENVTFDFPPSVLPMSKNKVLNSRKVGGEY